MPPPPDPSTLSKDVITDPQSGSVRPRALSPTTASRIQTKNRRKRYLDLHPEYFDSPSLELADPLAYDRLVRRFQSTQEREAEKKRKGHSGVLEANLWRAEARNAAAAKPERGDGGAYRREGNGDVVGEGEGEDGEVLKSKEEGLERWRREMETRFLRGEDEEFEYGDVDEREEFDDLVGARREEEERWFEEEEPRWVDGRAEDTSGEVADGKGEGLAWETGVQDF